MFSLILGFGFRILISNSIIKLFLNPEDLTASFGALILSSLDAYFDFHKL